MVVFRLLVRRLGVFGMCIALSIVCAVVVGILAFVAVGVIAVTVVVTFGVVLASGFLVGFGVTGAVVGA